jgi:hypothetical protein
LTIKGPAIADCVVVADELPTIPTIEVDLASRACIVIIGFF